jgi:hypothetical protein
VCEPNSNDSGYDAVVGCSEQRKLYIYIYIYMIVLHLSLEEIRCLVTGISYGRKLND